MKNLRRFFCLPLNTRLSDPGFASGHQPFFPAKPDVLQVSLCRLVEAAAPVVVKVGRCHPVKLRDQAIMVCEGCLGAFIFLASLRVVQHGVLKAAKEPVAGVVNVSVSFLLPGVAFCVFHVRSS